MISQERINEYLAAGQMEVQIIADSISEAGKRITTFQLKYWRAIHSELMTHRVFSRNASSSRAVPIEKMIKQVRENPAKPIHWGANQKGMQAKNEIPQDILYVADLDWRFSASMACENAEMLSNLGLHKQVVNRILEPFQHIHVVLTSTEFDNWEELRYHEDAQPEIWLLAKLMKEARENSEPKKLPIGRYHLPYITEDEEIGIDQELLCKISAARCCRVSYLKHDGTNPSIDDDLALFERLVGSAPLHASPLEHQATPKHKSELSFVSNLQGWTQYRKVYEASLYNS